MNGGVKPPAKLQATSQAELVPSGNDKRVLLDLNYPAFQAELFDLDQHALKPVIATFKKLRKLTWNEVFKDHGLNWEEIKTMKNKHSIRVSISTRAVVLRDGDYMRFQALHSDHDGAYGKK